MKIFCIGKNYAEHAKEMNSKVPDEPLVFMKPPTALLLNNKPFYYPDFSKNIHYEGEIVLRLGKNGKYIQSEFAEDYIDGVAFGIDFTARDIQKQCKEKGFPWEIAKGFDFSAAVSEFLPYNKSADRGISFSLYKNGKIAQSGNTFDMIFSFIDIIVYISKYFKIQIGDYIFTGTPKGVGPVIIGDKLEGFIGGERKLICDIK